MTKRLILADDSITIQKVVEIMLAGEGFEVRVANNGEEALAALSSFRPDIVLADVEMPGINGYRLCEKIKSDPNTMDIPVILLTSAFEPIDKELVKSVESDGFIVKPFDSQELISKINQVLAEKDLVYSNETNAVAAEAPGSEEDLMTMEEVVSESGVAEELTETPVEEAAITDNPDFAEAIETEAEPEKIISDEESLAGFEKDAAASYADLLSGKGPADISGKSIDEKVVDSLLSEIRDTLQPTIVSSIRDSVENIVREIVPGLAEKLLNEMLTGLAASLAKEAEKAILETVPGLSETIITREIERIKSRIKSEL